MSDKKDSFSARRVPFNTIQWPEDDSSTVRNGIWSSVTCPNFRIRSLSFRQGHAPSTMPLGIFPLMAACTFSTVASSRNLYVLACEHVCGTREASNRWHAKVSAFATQKVQRFPPPSPSPLFASPTHQLFESFPPVGFITQELRQLFCGDLTCRRGAVTACLCQKCK